MTQLPCPVCGYTEEDAAIHMDHHYCKGAIPVISFKFCTRFLGRHAHMRSFVRRTDGATWQLMGELVMHDDEYRAFRSALESQAEVDFEEDEVNKNI